MPMSHPSSPATLRWFAAEEHLDAAKAWVQAWSGERTLHLLDLFGASQSMSCLGWKCAWASNKCLKLFEII